MIRLILASLVFTALNTLAADNKETPEVKETKDIKRDPSSNTYVYRSPTGAILTSTQDLATLQIDKSKTCYFVMQGQTGISMPVCVENGHFVLPGTPQK